MALGQRQSTSQQRGLGPGDEKSRKPRARLLAGLEAIQALDGSTRFSGFHTKERLSVEGPGEIDRIRCRQNVVETVKSAFGMKGSTVSI